MMKVGGLESLKMGISCPGEYNSSRKQEAVQAVLHLEASFHLILRFLRRSGLVWAMNSSNMVKPDQ